jgi:hypothetical protein
MSRPLDLSSLPPDLRRAVEQQLAKLPPQAREKLLREGSPMLDRILQKVQGAVPPPLPKVGAGQHVTTAVRQTVAESVEHAKQAASAAAHQVARMAPRGHFNATIRPGDKPGGGRLLLVLLVAALLAAAFWPDAASAVPGVPLAKSALTPVSAQATAGRAGATPATSASK